MKLKCGVKDKCAVIKQNVDVFDPKKHPFMRKGTTVSQCPQVSNPATDDFVFGKLTGSGPGSYMAYDKSKSSFRVGTDNTLGDSASNSVVAGNDNDVGGSGAGSAANSTVNGVAHNVGGAGLASGANSLVNGMAHVVGGNIDSSAMNSLTTGSSNNNQIEGATVAGLGLNVDAGPTYSTTIGTYGSVADSVSVKTAGLNTRTGLYYMDGSSTMATKVGFSISTASIGPLANKTILRLSMDGMFLATGADYAELMEWLVKPETKLFRRFVDLSSSDPTKIELASNGSYIGITSKNPGIVGNEACFHWNKKFLKDENGNQILDQNYLYPFFDAVMVAVGTEKQLKKNIKTRFVDGITLEDFKTAVKEEAIKLDKLSVVQGVLDKQIQPILVPRLNPAFDQKTNYTERIYRPEWITVGFMGQLEVETDGTLVPGGFCKPGVNGIATAAVKGESTVRVMWQKGNIAGVVLK